MNSSLDSLSYFLQADQIKTDPKECLFYGKDWTSYFDIQAQAVVFPHSTEEIQKLVLWARQHKIGLVPSGGRTGLSSGACATQNEIIVSMERLSHIINFNALDQTLLCQAGVTTERVQEAASKKGFFFPIDFAAKGSSHLGGNVATNAGGLRVLRYGTTRQWVCGLKVVTGRGDLLNLNKGLVKNATGPDLMSHFIGSEGIFGFVTEVEVKLCLPPSSTQILLCALEDLDSLMECYQKFKNNFTLQAFEFFSDNALEKVLQNKNQKSPFSKKYPYYFLIEVESPTKEPQEELLTLFESCLHLSLIKDGLLAENSDQQKLFWSYREQISESLSPYFPYKNDISVRVSQVPAFLKAMEQTLKQSYKDWTVVWFGHLGDGNLHLNILRPHHLSKEEFFQCCRQIDPLVFHTVKQFQGAISAEHGVGLTKKPFLHLSRSPEELHIFRAMKSYYDPDGILNPGKVV
jgi:FAD/FMN-containing dehydrogenase